MVLQYCIFSLCLSLVSIIITVTSVEYKHIRKHVWLIFNVNTGGAVKNFDSVGLKVTVVVPPKYEVNFFGPWWYFVL